jgi:broad specificity phosphatase PhoE
MRIILVRHGETSWNIGEKKFRGQKDIPLSDFGLKQAEATGNALQKEPIEVIYYSPLQRTEQTAKGLKKYQKQAKFMPEKLLLDISFGAWEGRKHSEVFAENPEIEEYWNHQPEKLTFPEGESWYRVFERVNLLFKRLEKEQHKIVALVTHRVVASIMLLYLLGLNMRHFWDFQLDNASITEITLEPNGDYQIVKVNDTHHLPIKEEQKINQ